MLRTSDHQEVVRLIAGRPIAVVYPHRSGGGVDRGGAAVHDPYPVEAPEPVVGDPVVAHPLLGPGQPHTEFLTADQARLRGDTHDVGIPPEPNPGIAQSDDHHPGSDHVVRLRGGSGTNAEIR